MSSLGIILVSHGNFAKAALESAEMIAGKHENVLALSLEASKSIDDLEMELAEGYKAFSDKYENVLVICDIYGGTPFNAISRCKLKGLEMTAYTGLSLPLLIDLLFAHDLSMAELKQRIQETHAQALHEIVVELPADDEDDEIDL